MRVLVAGSSGFLGRTLVDRLRADGHQCIRLLRREGSAPDEITWNPATGELDPAVLTDVDAVINLAGSSLGTRLR
jgi:NAD dependent epimerase/dehydratase family enzyme